MWFVNVNVLCAEEEEEGGYPLKADSRPTWALLGKVNQNMETIAFKEKFIDWPDSARLIKVKGPETNGNGKVWYSLLVGLQTKKYYFKKKC